MSAETPMPEIAQLFVEAGGRQLQRCMQCGTCAAVCPWPTVGAHVSPRSLFRQAGLGLEGYEQEEAWTCVTCGACQLRCPRDIDIVEAVRAVRAVLQELEGGPRGYRGPLGSLRSDANPWSGERAERGRWAEGLDLPRFRDGQAYLLYTCCTQAYDPRNRRVARALVRLLRRAGLDFGVLPEQEGCCGEQARKVGAEELYQELASGTRALLDAAGQAPVITASPHCLSVLTEQAPGPAPVHHSRLLAELLAQGALGELEPRPLKVTFHDPCYLGRHGGDYDSPRQVLAAIPGLELLEMPRNRQESLCCGAGGGGLWQDVPPEQRFAALRIEEARATGAEVLATACPYCTTMFEDTVKVLGLEQELRVRDVAELLDGALPAGGAP